MKGKYVILEGIDGSGKGTVLEAVKHKFDIVTREPGSPHLQTCIDLRKILLHGESKNEFTTGLLFLADTHEHLLKIVLDNVYNGKSVLSDRCILSDLAYRPNFPENVRQPVLDLFLKLKPHIIFLDVLPEESLRRMKLRGALNSYEESQVVERLPELRQNYLKSITQFPHSFVDANGSIEESISQTNDILIALDEVNDE